MHDVRDRADIEAIVTAFYAEMLKDPIIGFIFTDIAAIDLEHHLPLIVDFWEDALFMQNAKQTPKKYTGNTLSVHLKLAEKIPLRAGHFTRWLYLFERAVNAQADGDNAQKMKQRARSVAKSIAAALSAAKRADMHLTLD